MNDLEFPGYNEIVKPEYKPLPKFPDLPEIEPKKKRGSSKVITVLVIILLLGFGGYVIYDLYTDYMLRHDTEITEQAIQYGSELTVIEIIQFAVTCQEVPLTIQNQTLNIIAVDCLGLGEQNG